MDSRVPWSQAVTMWGRWRRAGGISATTVTYECQVARQLAAHHRGRDPWDLTTKDLSRFLRDRAVSTARGYRWVYVSFYRWAIANGLTDHDPTRNLSPAGRTVPRPRPASDTDVIAALALAPSERERLMLRLGAQLGLRAGEIAQVHRTDLREEPGERLVLVVAGKGDKSRDVPCPDDLAEAIAQQCSRTGWAFPSPRGGHLTSKHVSRLVGRLLPPGAHSLRHRFATRAYALECDLLAVQELLGHASANTTRMYVATPALAMRRTVELLERGE
jgi:integrase